MAGPRSKHLWRWLLAAVAGGAILLVLARFSDAEALAAAWKRFDPALFAAAAGLFLINIGARAWRLRALTGTDGRGPFLLWLRLAAMHQVVFMLLPSGTGDVGYPVLASRLVGTKTGEALRVLVIYRIQDLMTLLVIAAFGLLLHGGVSVVGPVTVMAAIAASFGLLAAPDFARLALLLLGRLLAVVTFRSERTERLRNMALDRVRLLSARVPTGIRFQTALACLVAWAAAAASLWTLFAMAQMPLDPGEIMIVIAGINLVGALTTFTIAGLGVTEGGLAVLLMLLGHPAGDAAAIALTVRPLALVGSLAVCGLVELGVRFDRFRRGATRPTSGITGAQE